MQRDQLLTNFCWLELPTGAGRWRLDVCHGGPFFRATLGSVRCLEERTRIRAAIIAFLETWIELAEEIATAYLIGGRWTRHEVWDSKRGSR
jgi:hypothetical protein